MTIFRIKKDKHNPYTMMSNWHLRDEKLSWKAKGMLSFLLHLPDYWHISLEDLKKRAKDQRNSTETTMKELIREGYIVKKNRKRIKDSMGRFIPHDYDVFEKPK